MEVLLISAIALIIVVLILVLVLQPRWSPITIQAAGPVHLDQRVHFAGTMRL